MAETRVELRDRDEARRYLLQGLGLQRAGVPHPSGVGPTLDWALELIDGGDPLPPLGLVADFGQAALGRDRDAGPRREPAEVPGWGKELAPRYEDYVLGKLYADWTFERAADAVRGYLGPTQRKDQARGVAYILRRFRDRAGFTAVDLAPGVVRGLAERKPDEVLEESRAALAEGPSELLLRAYREVVAACRRMAEVLGEEDVLALEQRMALADKGQEVAYHQVLRQAIWLRDKLPRQKVRPLHGRREVPTRVLDEDTYPVGGFTSISNRGSIESLLHSQLAYMEPPGTDAGPDLFDIRFLRDELYYYSRDENQFLRRRRSFVFALWPELKAARFKDSELPCQRIVMTLALLLTSVWKLSEWLSTDALTFEFVFLGPRKNPALDHEYELLEMLLREPIANGTVVLRRKADLDYAGRPKDGDKADDAAAIAEYSRRLARRTLCHCLNVRTELSDMEVDDVVVSQLVVDGPRPSVGTGHLVPEAIESDDAPECWAATLDRLLRLWV